jgi:hypothetical protein
MLGPGARMTLSTILIVAALAASIFLITQKSARVFAILAAVVSGVALTLALGFISIRVSHVDLVIGIALAVLGVVLLFRVDEKFRVVASTVIAMVGAVMALGTL